MEQRTCNIIMCCKGHCQLEGAGETSMEAIAAYMSHECACPKEDYKGRLMESILEEALFDYLNGANPAPTFGGSFTSTHYMIPAYRNAFVLCFSLLQYGTILDSMPMALRIS